MEMMKLNSRISIVAMSEEENEFGEDAPAEEETIKTIWAAVAPRTGSLLSGRPADTMLSKTTHAITIRAESMAGIKTDHRVIWKDAVGQTHKFAIDYLLPPGPGQHYATIYASEEI